MTIEKQHEKDECPLCQQQTRETQSVFDTLANEHNLSDDERRRMAQELNDLTGLNLG